MHSDRDNFLLDMPVGPLKNLFAGCISLFLHERTTKKLGIIFLVV